MQLVPNLSLLDTSQILLPTTTNPVSCHTHLHDTCHIIQSDVYSLKKRQHLQLLSSSSHKSGIEQSGQVVAQQPPRIVQLFWGLHSVSKSQCIAIDLDHRGKVVKYIIDGHIMHYSNTQELIFYFLRLGNLKETTNCTLM